MGGKRLPKIMPPCEVEGCKAKVWQRTRGQFLCVSHAQRLLKYGAVDIYHQRFRRKAKWIEENAGYTGDDCLRWPFDVSDHGRGTVQFNNKSMSAPRGMCIVAHGPPPSPKHQAAHSCGNGHLGCMNPRHLSWKLPKENEADKVLHGTLRRGSEINTSKLSEDQVRAIRAKLSQGLRGVELAKKYGVTPTMISNIKTKKAWAWLVD